VDLSKVLAQLRLELENLDMAIASLERLAAQKQRSRAEAPVEGKRRGRPPKAAVAVPHAGADLEKRPGTK
jgi:hypothetical protein